MTISTWRSSAAATAAAEEADSETPSVPAKHKAGSRAAQGMEQAFLVSSQGSPSMKGKKASSVTLSMEEYAELLKLKEDQQKSKAKQKSAEKAKKIQEDLAIQARNKALLEQEDGEESEQGSDDNSPPSKKQNQPPFAQMDSPAEDDAEMADGEDEDEDDPNMDQTNMDHTDEEHEAPEDGDGGSEEQELAIVNANPPKEKEDSDMKPNSKVDASKKKPKSKSKGQSEKNYKVVLDNFKSSDVLALAERAKCYLRTQICFGNWVLDSDEKRPNWVWSILNETPSILPPIASAMAAKGLEIAGEDDEVKKDLLTYVLYGKTCLFNNIITKVRQCIAGYFSLTTGSDANIKVKVEWLLTKSNFLYGGLDIKEKTVNRSKPFGNPIIRDIIQNIWFSTAKNGSKSDLMTTDVLVLLQEEQEKECKEAEKKKPQLGDFDETVKVGNFIEARPAQRMQGCISATAQFSANDTFGLAQVDNTIALKALSAAKPSKKALADGDLTFSQMSMAKNTFLNLIEKYKWHKKAAQALGDFFFGIEVHHMRQLSENGEKTLIHYQVQVRREWHDQLALGNGFNIGLINEVLINTIYSGILNELQVASINQAQHHQANRSAPYVLAPTHTTPESVTPTCFGMELPKHNARRTAAGDWSTQMGMSFAMTGTTAKVAHPHSKTIITSALDVEARNTALRTVLEHR
ncbi:hypothetical protein CPB84DRAFT_1852208 [Gymnopilus junonius]|uniref:DUF6532 domain-containing protein n=1 Tax=Gymnopilus junonius TaxID=109634 RepID=A0A9P5NC81_GYMJU|nr:hypothetical protein CPB84DRAFT_1852208 [Gymnopilus junonius]